MVCSGNVYAVDMPEEDTPPGLHFERQFRVRESHRVFLVKQFRIMDEEQIDLDEFSRDFVQSLPPFFQDPKTLVNGVQIYTNNLDIYRCLCRTRCCRATTTPVTKSCTDYFASSPTNDDCPALDRICNQPDSDPTLPMCKTYCDVTKNKCPTSWYSFCDSNNRFQSEDCIRFFASTYGPDISTSVNDLLQRRCQPFVDTDGNISPNTPLNVCGCFMPPVVYNNYYQGIGVTEADSMGRQCSFPFCANPTALALTQNADCSSVAKLHACALTPTNPTADYTTTIRKCNESPTTTDGEEESKEGYAKGKKKTTPVKKQETQSPEEKKTSTVVIVVIVLVVCMVSCAVYWFFFIRKTTATPATMPTLEAVSATISTNTGMPKDWVTNTINYLKLLNENTIRDYAEKYFPTFTPQDLNQLITFITSLKSR